MYKNIDASDIKGMIGKINIIDIRKNYLYKLGNIPTSKNIPKDILLEIPSKYLNFKDTYYIYCTQGLESIKVCDELSKKGYKIVNLVGGYQKYLMS